MTLLVESTPIALWHKIIHEAEATCSMTLPDDLESYLVFLLARYINKPEMVKEIMAQDFLKGLKLTAKLREVALQEVGDKCLIFTGLFPKIAEKRLVKISYYVNLGQAAYGHISKKHTDLYYSLAQQFVGLMDVLQSVRVYSKEHPDLLPLQAYDLWSDTGSQRALSVLKGYTNGIPLRIIKDDLI